MAKKKVTLVLLDDEDVIVVYVEDQYPEPKHTITRQGKGLTYWELTSITPSGSQMEYCGPLDKIYDILYEKYKALG